MRAKHPTTNLTSQPRAIHIPHQEFDNPDDPEPSSSQVGTLNPSEGLVQREKTADSNNIRPKPQQLAISNYFQRPISAGKKKILDQQVIRMIAKEYYSLSIVEDPEFKKFVNMLNPTYVLPSRKTISTSLLPVLYNQIYDQVKDDICNNAQFVSLTTDGWTSLRNESYLAVTVHFIDINCELKTYLLSCEKLPDRHTSENLKTSLQQVVNNWGIQNKVVACTSDNAANISLVVRLCQWGQHFCFAHTLNIIVQSSLEEILKILEIK